MKKQKIVLIGGPTGVGKTALSVRLAQIFDGEVISCDSVAIYKGFDIGSAKPTQAEQCGIKHHLIDIKEPTEEYSVAEYKQDADLVISQLSTQGKLPIICGGTGFYMKGLLFDLQLGCSEKSTELRQKYKALAEQFGNQYLLDKLNQIDPVSASKLHPKDLARIIRALEIFELTGKIKSSYVQNFESKYDYKLIFLNDDRKELYKRIDNRVEQMFADGLLAEVDTLVKTYNLNRQNQSMGAIGYKEFFDYFDGKISIEDVKEQIKLNCRHYAKRQITWFKSMPNVQEYNCNDIQKIVDDIKLFLNS